MKSKILAKILELFRDITFAHILGMGSVAEAFFVALRLLLLFQISAPPSHDSQNMQQHTNAALRFVLITSISLTILMEVIMPIFMYVLTPGFIQNAPKFRLTILLAQTVFPCIIFISVNNVINQILKSLNRNICDASEIMGHLCTICAIFLMTQYSNNAAFVLVLSLLFALILQLSYAVINLNKAGIEITLTKTPKNKNSFTVITPEIILKHIPQLSILISIVLASFTPNHVTYLYYGLQIQHILVFILLIISTKSATQDTQKYLEISMLLSLPLVTMFAIMSDEITYILFQHGKFKNAAKLAQILTVISMGIPANVLNMILKDLVKNHDLIKIYIKYLSINIILSALLILQFKHIGIALGTSISAWILLFMIGMNMENKIVISERIKKLLPCCLPMALVMSIIASSLHNIFAHHSLLIQILALAITIFAGIFIYLTTLIMTRTYSKAELKESLST